MDFAESAIPVIGPMELVEDGEAGLVQRGEEFSVTYFDGFTKEFEESQELEGGQRLVSQLIVSKCRLRGFSLGGEGGCCANGKGPHVGVQPILELLGTGIGSGTT